MLLNQRLLTKMRRGVLSKNIWEGASKRRNENIIVSGTLKIGKWDKNQDFTHILVFSAFNL